MNKAQPSSIQIYTDGACSGNPGPGGWGVVLISGRHRKELSGFEADTTNNRMELKAVIEGLNAIKNPAMVHITTDSKYVLQGATEWIFNWKRNGWKNAAKKPVSNAELWQELDLALRRHVKISWEWIKGHSGHPENEKADTLAVDAIKRSVTEQTEA